MFEQASREKYRFDTERGMISVEDLWDLPLEPQRGYRGPSLDEIALALHRHIESVSTVSFVRKDAALNPTYQNKLDIVKRVIEVRLAEAKAAEEKRTNAERKQKLLGILAAREDESLKALPIEELRKLIGEL